MIQPLCTERECSWRATGTFEDISQRRRLIRSVTYSIKKLCSLFSPTLSWMIEWNRLCNELTNWMWKAQPTRLSETVANQAAGIQTPTKRCASLMHEFLNQQRSRNPLRWVYFLWLELQWKEINLEYLHGKWCEWQDLDAGFGVMKA